MLVLLQFDSPSLALLERLLAAGRLPALAGLRSRGPWLSMDAQATFLQSSTYMTLCTGVDVREHGIYSAVPWSAELQRPRFMYRFPHPPTIWERLTGAGRRALVIDPTLAWPPRRINGTFLGGWQFEDRMSARADSLPRALRRDLARRHGRPPALDDVYGTRSAASLLAWRDHLVRAPGRVADAAASLLRREAFDVAWLNFAAAHKAGHHLWDPAGVMRDAPGAEAEAALRDGLAAVYEAVDAAMARILAILPPSADVIAFSPTGMAANTSRADLLPDMLAAVLDGSAPRGAPRRRVRSPIWTLRSMIPAGVRDRIAGLLPDDLVADIATRLYARRDWGSTRAFEVPGENKGYIRINLRGRERHGVVPAAEVGELQSVIIDGLLSFRDPDGSPPIAKVVRLADMATEGAALGRLPDLVVHWGEQPAARVGRVESPRYGAITRRGVGSGRSGNHVDDAWLVLAPAASRLRDLGRPPRITDIGATACAWSAGDTTGLGGRSLLEPS